MKFRRSLDSEVITGRHTVTVPGLLTNLPGLFGSLHFPGQSLGLAAGSVPTAGRCPKRGRCQGQLRPSDSHTPSFTQNVLGLCHRKTVVTLCLSKATTSMRKKPLASEGSECQESVRLGLANSFPPHHLPPGVIGDTRITCADFPHHLNRVLLSSPGSGLLRALSPAPAQLHKAQPAETFPLHIQKQTWVRPD